GLRLADDPFALWPQLGLGDDAAHAFYMGVELARAEIAWRLGKRYVQDQPLAWGCAVERDAESLDAWCSWLSQPRAWVCVSERDAESLDAWCAPGTTLRREDNGQS